ncbi:MAG: cytochrome P450 family protein [Thermocrispum sp.]
MTHPDVFKGGPQGPHRDTIPPELSAAMDQHMLSSDGPDHARLRRLVAAAFSRRRIDALEPRVRRIAHSLLEEIATAGSGGNHVEVAATLAYPLPSAVISELLGVPASGNRDIQRWSTVVLNGSVHASEIFLGAATEMIDYIRQLLDAKRAEPGDDLLSALIAVRDDDDRLSDDELTSTVLLLLAAGHETTANLIAGAVHALLTHPDQLVLARAAPDRIPAIIEEVLRWNGPAQATTPFTTAAPVHVGGTTIPAGAVVLPALLAINRDPNRFPDPDRFDSTRAPVPHLAFGHGVHHCLGAPLARLEARIAIEMLIEPFPALRLAVPDTELRWRSGLLVNAITALPVTVR